MHISPRCAVPISSADAYYLSCDIAACGPSRAMSPLKEGTQATSALGNREKSPVVCADDPHVAGIYQEVHPY